MPVKQGLMSEEELQVSVLELARWRGWLCYHTYDSRRSEPGFPDLVMVRAGKAVYAELKSDTGPITKDQKRWRERLERHVEFAGPYVEYYLWRPDDWLSGKIEEALR